MGLEQRVRRLENAYVDITPRIRQIAVELGLAPDAAVAEAQQIVDEMRGDVWPPPALGRRDRCRVRRG